MAAYILTVTATLTVDAPAGEQQAIEYVSARLATIEQDAAPAPGGPRFAAKGTYSLAEIKPA